MTNRGEYSFKTRLGAAEMPLADVVYADEDNYSLLFYKASKDKLVVVVKQTRNFLEFITLFAYMFCLFLLIIAIYSLVDLLVRARLQMSNLKTMLNLSIRTKVQTTIIFAVAFSFIALGIATILFFINRYRAENAQKLSETVQSIGKDMEEVFYNHRQFDEMGMIYDSIFSSRLSTAVGEIAREHNVDINIYDTEGRLQLTTQPLMIEKGLLSPGLNPMAYYQLSQRSRIQFIQEEKIGRMRYISSYVPMRSQGKCSPT